MINEACVNLQDYERWRTANNEQFSLHDYAYAVMLTKRVPADALLAFVELVWPNFIEVDGLVLVAEHFDQAKLIDLRSRDYGGSELEFWMNIFSVDGLLQGLPGDCPSHAVSLAKTLQQTWEAKLIRDFPGRRFRVQVVEDESVGDVCVVFNQEQDE